MGRPQGLAWGSRSPGRSLGHQDTQSWACVGPCSVATASLVSERVKQGSRCYLGPGHHPGWRCMNLPPSLDLPSSSAQSVQGKTRRHLNRPGKATVSDPSTNAALSWELSSGEATAGPSPRCREHF